MGVRRGFRPEVLLLSPCGCRMEEICEAAHGLRKLRRWSHLRAVRAKRVYVVNPICTHPVRPPWWVWSYWHTCSILKYVLTMETDQHRFIRFASWASRVKGDRWDPYLSGVSAWHSGATEGMPDVLDPKPVAESKDRRSPRA